VVGGEGSITQGVKNEGHSWENITESFPGRTAKACMMRYSRITGAANPSKGAARTSRRGSNDSSDDEDNSFSNNKSEDDDEEMMAASEPAAAALPLDDDVVLPPVISSLADHSYYPQPLPPNIQRRTYSSSGSRRDEKTIANFTCGICCRLLFRAQVMRPCGHCTFCEECVPPLDARASACFTPFEQVLRFRSGDNVVDNMVRAGMVKKDAADEWKSREAEYARESAQGGS
jgi:hypothetical protein